MILLTLDDTQLKSRSEAEPQEPNVIEMRSHEEFIIRLLTSMDPDSRFLTAAQHNQDDMPLCHL